MKTKYIHTLVWGFYFFLLMPAAYGQIGNGRGDGYGVIPYDHYGQEVISPQAIGDIVDGKLDFFYEFIKTRLHCHKIGTIVTFDPTMQTASVRINHKIGSHNLDPNYQYLYWRYSNVGPGRRNSTLVNPLRSELTDYPLLKNVPVFIPAGGGAAVTMPVQPGDTCLVVFSDLDISTWFLKGETNALPPTERNHDIRDALAIVGFRPMTNVIENYNAKDAELRNADASIAVGADGKVSIKNDRESLHGVLSELVKCLKEFTVATDTGATNDETKKKLKEIETKLNTLLK